jgi:8-oxo-dGTP pyrophosphatase MutT (NUDIX family)
VPLVLRDDGLHVVLTRRHADLALHGGEISFPGGRPDPGDADLPATALREAHEEIGLAPADVLLAGALPPTPTIVTNYRVYPFVGLVDGSREWRPEPREVDEVLELGLGAQRDPAPDQPLEARAEVFVVGDALVWGATAKILGDLIARLAPLDGGSARPGRPAAPPRGGY